MIMRRLGRRPSIDDPRTLRMATIVTTEMPASPSAIARDESVPAMTDLYANDAVGDCTAASAAHLIEVWTEYGKIGALATVDDVLKFYSIGGGYVAGDPTTDTGADMLTMLKTWRSVGVGGHRIDAFVKLDLGDVAQVKSAINFFGGVYVGANLPLTAQHGGEWVGPEGLATGEETPGSWGGHCMSASRYDRRGAWLRTWGRLQFADWAWWRRYVDECYAPLSTDWVHGDEAPNGLNIEKLRAYLVAL